MVICPSPVFASCCAVRLPSPPAPMMSVFAFCMVFWSQLVIRICLSNTCRIFWSVRFPHVLWVGLVNEFIISLGFVNLGYPISVYLDIVFFVC